MEKKDEKRPLLSDAEKNIQSLKEILSAQDILVYRFETADKKLCAAVYADGITDKELLGELAARPLAQANAPKNFYCSPS